MMKEHEKSSDKLSPKVNALLIIDVQEKIIRPIFNKDLITKNIKKLIDAYQILEENIFLSEQNPFKLGATIPELLPKNGFRKFEKMEFSCINNKNFIKYINDYNFKNIIVSGIETHICVLQTSMDLLQKGLNILIPRDAIGSRNKMDNYTAFLRLILSGAVASTTESLICELCKTSNRKEFREVSKILKNSFSN